MNDLDFIDPCLMRVPGWAPRMLCRRVGGVQSDGGHGAGQMWMDDFVVGDRFYSGEEIEITEEAIVAFAEEYDPQPGHLSEEAALATPFGGLAASGWHTAAVTMRLLFNLGFTGIIGAQVTLAWPTPTRPGDRLHVDVRVTSKRDSASKPDRGVVTLEYDTLNHEGEVRQKAQTVIIAWHRPNQ